MHRCLLVDEILRLIATHTVGSRGTLFNMALTCKTFHGPANDLLWEDLPGLRPLLSLLPKDAYGTSGPVRRFRSDEIPWVEVSTAVIISQVPY